MVEHTGSRRMRLGFEAITWQIAGDRYMGQIEHIADLVRECGGEGIEPEVCMLGKYVDDPSGLRELLHTRGTSLAAICYVEDWRCDGETDDESARAAEAIEYISAFPGSLLQLCPRSGKDRASLRERQKNAIRCINDVARRAAGRGIVCAVHPNWSAGSAFRTHDDYEILLNGLDSSIVGFVPDSGNMIRGGMDPLETIRTFRPLVRHLHLKDISASGEWIEMGRGITDFTVIISYLADTGYEGWVIVEDISALAIGDPDEATRRNAAYVRHKLVPLMRRNG